MAAPPCAMSALLECVQNVMDVRRGEPVGVLSSLAAGLLLRTVCSGRCSEHCSGTQLSLWPAWAWPQERFLFSLSCRCGSSGIGLLPRVLLLDLCVALADRLKKAEHGEWREPEADRRRLSKIYEY